VKFAGPGDQDRFTIIGATGSGKTYAAMYNLSRRNYNIKPWIIYDFKGEELIARIPEHQTIEFDSPLPERPGIYVLRPFPGQEDMVDEHMMRVWEREDIGVYIDEGYMVGQRSNGFRCLLTQGRSKRIPMIINSQRPVYMDRFVFSESQFFQIFRLQHSDDIKTVEKFVPRDLSALNAGTDGQKLPRFHSYFYDVIDDKMYTWRPGPDESAILDNFDARMPRMRRVI
jgi:hypothetical protein